MAYFRYKIKNTEPIRISDDSTSQSGQTVSLRYIPGSAVRGAVINALADTLGDRFEEYKCYLFSGNTKFLNAYMFRNQHELIPSPKGFYEDKTVSKKKQVENVVIDGEFTEGMKRAGLGRFSYIENDCIYYYGVNTGSDMKIRINHVKKSDVFRNEYMSAGNVFVGYISVGDDIKGLIESVFTDEIIIGNARSQGLGKCKVLEKGFIDEKEIPYSEYMPKNALNGKCYMMLLSNTLMRNEAGELAGLDLETLEKKLGVSRLEIEHCATSTINVRGYNRVWGSKIPSANMYEMGSVFKLSFDGELTVEKMCELMTNGIGVRRNEGFGRVLFIDNYEKVCYKQEGPELSETDVSTDKYADDDKTIRSIAKIYYKRILEAAMQEHILDKVDSIGLKKSQVGKVLSLVSQNRYDSVKGTEIVKNYFSHAKEKQDNRNIQKEKGKIDGFMKRIIAILDKPLKDTLGVSLQNTVMGVPVEELLSADELQRMKFDYIIELIKYENKEDR